MTIHDLKTVINADTGTGDVVGGDDWDNLIAIINGSTSGAATVLNGNTTVTVTHGLAITPNIHDIHVTPTNNLGSATKFWVSGPNATDFTINVDANPGAGTATFSWMIVNLT